MRIPLLAVASILCGTALTVAAEVLSLSPDAGLSALPDVPQRGDSQIVVMRTYGEPTARHAAVGGDRPRQPPITRWDYEGYSVFFERDKVIDVVIKDRPARVHHMDELQAQP